MQINLAKNIELWPVARLKPYARNARTHSVEQIEKIAASMLRFGFNNPILVDATDGIVAGHGRLLAAQQIGLEEIPVVVLTHLTEDERRAYILADNKLHELGGWDRDLLNAEVEALKAEGIDLSDVGFSDEELERALAFLPEEPIAAPSGGIQQAEAEAAEVPDMPSSSSQITHDPRDDDVPDHPSEVQVQHGDLFLLGEHRLLCGDATSRQDVDRLLGDTKPNLMVTDPPYGVEYEAGWRAEAKGREKTDREKTSILQNDDRADWKEAWDLFPGAVAYVWHASAFTDVVMDSLRNSGFDVKQQIIWNKNVHALSRSHYHWKHEPCWYAVRKGGESRWRGSRKEMTVWNIPSVIFEKDKTAHPTQKALGIYEVAILNHTVECEPIYDPFGGSGTQIIACEKHNRISFTMELDPKFCQVILERWERYTGKQAMREDGIPWRESRYAKQDA